MLAGRNGNLDLYRCLSLIGYCILPVVITSALALFVPRGGPRVAPQKASDNSTEVSDYAALPMDQGVISKESTSKESNLSELSSNNCVDSRDEPEIDDGDVNPDEEMAYSPDNCSISKRELADDFLQSKFVPEEAGAPYSSEGETELRDKESVSVDFVCDRADDINGDNYLHTLEGENELKGQRSRISRLKLDSVPSAYHDHSNINDLDDACMEKEATESGEKKESSGQPVVSFELYSIPSVSYDYLHYLNSLPTSSLASCDDLNELHMASVTTTDDWWYDSGATTHVCNNRDLFQTYKETEDGHEVMMGDNHTSKVIGSGNVEIQFTSGKKLTLMNVLHVANIRKNLVSGFKLCKSGVKAVIESDKVIMSKANVFVRKAYACDGMFKLNINKTTSSAYLPDCN
nr:zinc finger, CCHC-type [Tanacetum cinerariifolium]